MTVTAFVPMKGHSARVPNKNIRPLAGKPLYHWITLSLLNAKRVDRVVIETDSDRIADDAKRNFPGLTILRRPKELWGDDTPMNKIIAFHMSEVAERHLSPDPLHKSPAPLFDHRSLRSTNSSRPAITTASLPSMSGARGSSGPTAGR